MECGTGSEEFGVAGDLLDSQVVGVAGRWRGRGITAHPGPRDVGHHPEGPHEVGVEGHHVSVPDDRGAALLEPRVGAVPSGQQPAFHPLAVAGQHLGPQHTPQLVFGHAGVHGLEHPVTRDERGVHRATHGADLVGALDLSGLLHDLRALHEGQALVE